MEQGTCQCRPLLYNSNEVTLGIFSFLYHLAQQNSNSKGLPSSKTDNDITKRPWDFIKSENFAVNKAYLIDDEEEEAYHSRQTKKISFDNQSTHL